jgi:hypothetical protein
MNLTINKTVFWDTGNGNKTGKIKKIMGSHAIVKTVDSEYLVQKSCLKTKTVSKLAALSSETKVR